MEFIEKYLDKPWNWYYIPRNPNITMEIIEKHPEKPWDRKVYLVIQILLWNILRIILINLRGWVYPIIKILLNIIEKYSDKHDWEYISCNQNITMGIIEKYLDKDWDWGVYLNQI